MAFDPKGTVFEWMFKPDHELTKDDILIVHDIARMGLIVHPDVYRRIMEILDGPRRP